MKRLVFIALLPLCAYAELDVYTVDNNVENLAPALIDLGTGPAGDELAIRFRLRNSGKQSELLDYLRAAGSGFRITGAVTPPYIIAPGTNYDFHVRFSTQNAGVYSANLIINTKTILLRATATGTLAVTVDGVPIAAGDTIDFGKIERKKTGTRELTIVNGTAEIMNVATLAVTGTAFHLDGEWPVPLPVAAGEIKVISVTCAPEKSGLLAGTLDVNGRAFALSAYAVEPPPPRPIVRVDTAAVASAQQVKVTVLLSETSRANTTGTLKLELRNAKDDGMLFVASGKPTIDFEIREGDVQARFGTRTDATLQTGTTAGSITLTATIAGYTDQMTLAIPASNVRIDSGSVVRDGSNLLVTAAGYDNTRTLSQVAFTFYDTKGALLTSAPIQLDASADFKRFFDASTLGGMFSLKASFPVTGDISRIAAVEIDMKNANGATKSDKLRF